MTTKQNLSILFFPQRDKIDSTGLIPIYVRVTIDGLRDQISTGCKVLSHHWNSEYKQVLPENKFHKEINKKLHQMQTDLERQFDLIQAKDGLATPVLGIESWLKLF